ncbi:hypothetical protein BVC80_1183g26 [Macleaya cordata]|uniref:Uncharacterized protein n=1 Tax=Macleaya cordata TaxID=56857 RepID=A0A200PQ73_MACCD|nr:hypothetical protein BVC80_1183g26 [Macleaya cordata]
MNTMVFANNVEVESSRVLCTKLPHYKTVTADKLEVLNKSNAASCFLLGVKPRYKLTFNVHIYQLFCV